MTPTIRDIEVICTAPEGINLVVVKVLTTEPGLFGLGCATFSYRHLTVVHILETYFKPLLLGKPVNRISELWQLMHQNAYWRYGPVCNNAISGIDMALWDIKGRMANMPLYELFGGKMRDGVAVYRHADGADSHEVCENIARYKGMGVRYLRCQCGGYGGNEPIKMAKGAPSGVYLDGRAYMRKTIKLFEHIREKLGFELELVHDIHERLHPTEARVFCREMEPFRMYFLEDPVSLENLDWLNDIRAHTVTPIAQGELFNNPNEWRKLIESRAIDFIRVHISQVGGITAARRLALFAEQYDVRICWHGPGDMSPIAHAANVHIDLAAANFGLQEWSGLEPPNVVLQKLNSNKGALLEVFHGLPEYGNDGYVYPNDTPGIGVEIDEKAAAKYPCENTVTTWTQTRHPDGSLITP